MATAEKKITELTQTNNILSKNLFILLLGTITKKLQYDTLSDNIKSDFGIINITNNIASNTINITSISNALSVLNNTVGNSTKGLVLSVNNISATLYAANTGLTCLSDKVNNLISTVLDDNGLSANFNTLSTKIYGDNYRWNLDTTNESLSARIYSLEQTLKAGISRATDTVLGGFNTGFDGYSDNNYTYLPVLLSTVGDTYKAYAKIAKVQNTDLLQNNVNTLTAMSSFYATNDGDSKIVPIETTVNTLNKLINTTTTDATDEYLCIKDTLSTLASFDYDDVEEKFQLEDGYILSHDVILLHIAQCRIDNIKSNTEEISVTLTGGLLATLSNLVCPVNCVRFSITDTNPYENFGGTWVSVTTSLTTNGIYAWKRTK